jgi:transposase InsO family protein
MMAIGVMLDNKLSLRKALHYSGCSRAMYYYRKRDRKVVRLDPAVVDSAKRITLERPFYGTRRMAVMLSRELGRPVNRKQVQRVFHALNWVEPSKKKVDIIRSKGKTVKASRPYELWEADMSYIWCGIDGWCYLFNVIDVFSREWISYAFDTCAVKEDAIQSVMNALAAKNGIDLSRLTLRVDNGPQYRSNAFMDSMKALGIRLEFIYRNTPEQNGHIESFHKTLKREYIWINDFSNYQEAEIAIGKAFTDYNRYRIHSALEYKTPYEFLSQWEMMNK